MQNLDLTIGELCKILESEPVGLTARVAKRKVKLCLDSREAAPGVVFWPLKGGRFDGHDFIPEVMKKGALMSVMDADRTGDSLSDVYVPVDDSNKALLKLAKGYQRLFKLKKIAITGSNGKTTTKEMLKTILSEQFKTVATEGNFNNQIGVPKTIFRFKHSDEVAVVEMGTSAPGEIHPLSMTVEPDIAVITNVGASHLECLGDMDNVFKEKITIADGLKKGGLLVVNADDSRLSKLRTNTRYRVLTFGIKRGVVKPENLTWDANACARFKIGRTEFHLNVPGIHNVYNALAAIAVTTAMRMPKSVIASALEKFRRICAWKFGMASGLKWCLTVTMRTLLRRKWLCRRSELFQIRTAKSRSSAICWNSAVNRKSFIGKSAGWCRSSISICLLPLEI